MGHYDKLGFVTYGFGEILVLDPGSISCASSLNGQWHKRSLAHNLIVVDEKDQRPATGRMMLFRTAPNLALAHTDAGDVYDGVRVTRTVAMVHDTFIVIDRVHSEETHTYDWVFHNRGTFEAGAEMKPHEGALGKNEPYLVPREIR